MTEREQMMEALWQAVIAMGRAGANYDTTHPQRVAWVLARDAFDLAKRNDKIARIRANQAAA